MAGTTYNKFALSASRMDRIFKAESLNDAQRMGLWDKFKDLLRGGAKKEAIRHAFSMLKNVKDAGNRAEHEGLLEHFNNLRLGLYPQHTKTLKLNVSVDENARTWSYEISIFGQLRAHASGLKIDNGFTLESFRDCKLLAEAGSWLYEWHGVDAGDELTRLHDRFLTLNMEGINGQRSAAQVRIAKACDIMRALDELRGVPKSVQIYADFGSVSSVKLSMDAEKGEEFIIDSALELKAIEDFKSVLVAKADLAAMQAVREVANIPKSVRIDGVLKEMVDNESDRTAFAASIKDTFFSRKNLVRFELHTNDTQGNPRFKAIYGDSGGLRNLVFSNRGSTNGEFRAAVLRDVLRNTDYDSMEDLIGGMWDAPARVNVLAHRLNAVDRQINRSKTMLLKAIARGERPFGLADQPAATKHVEDARDIISQSIYVGLTPLNSLPGWARQVQVEPRPNRGKPNLLVDYDFA